MRSCPPCFAAALALGDALVDVPPQAEANGPMANSVPAAAAPFSRSRLLIVLFWSSKMNPCSSLLTMSPP